MCGGGKDLLRCCIGSWRSGRLHPMAFTGSREQTQELMKHKKVALILATGGGSLVSAAYSSGTPTLGVGAGNVPVFIEKSADVPFAVEQIIMSKAFDNGTICASEQSIIVEKVIADQVKEEFIKTQRILHSRCRYSKT